MKTHGHYETISSVKYASGIVDCLYGREIKNTKVKQNLFRAKNVNTVQQNQREQGAIMKTKQEQIEEIQEIIGDSYEYDSISSELGSGDWYINIEEAAKAIVEAGYGDVSEYKAEIERLKADLDHQIDATNDAENLADHLKCDFDKARKQAKIDVLNKAKERLDSAPNGWAYTTYIDELIEEVENEK